MYVTLQGDNTELFISFIKLDNPATSLTIAQLLKEVMASAGTDTSVFKAHSIRGASTSAASMQGVTTEDILSTADRSTELTFQKFNYKRLNVIQNRQLQLLRKEFNYL